MHIHPATGSLLLPLKNRRFCQLWLANFLSNLGSAMQAFALTWEFASLSHSALAQALLQAMSWAPIMLFALPAGVLADAMCRPTLLFRSNAILAACAGAMVVSAVLARHATTPLLLLTFAMASGKAFVTPAWQASMASLVQPDQVEAAANLNNLSFNAAALLGPVLGAACFAEVGAAGLFAFNACSFGALLWLYWRLRMDAVPAPRPRWRAQLLVEALSLAWRTLPFRRLLVHTACIFAGASALPVYLPLLAADAGQYGAALGALGAGALCAGVSLPLLRRRLSRQILLAAALAVFGGMLVALGAGLPWVQLLAAVFCGGVAWAAIVTTLNGAAQLTFPDTQNARMLAVYIVVVAAGQTLGSLGWAMLAGDMGNARASQVAALLVLACAVQVVSAPSFLDHRCKSI